MASKRKRDKRVVYARSILDLNIDDYNYFNTGGMIVWGRVQHIISKENFQYTNIYIIDSIEIILKYGLEDILI